MLALLKDFFAKVRPATDPGEDTAHLLQLACAVMWVEVMRADDDLDASERMRVMAALQDTFGLTHDESQELAMLGEEAVASSTDLFCFTSRINDAFGMEEKLRMIEHMWRVAYADGQLAAHENHLMRKAADLLYIPQGAYVHAKQRAREAVEGESDADPMSSNEEPALPRQ